MSRKYDYIIIGAGLVGISTAFHLKRKDPKKSVVIVEKESTICRHQSGHNSGVIHSGIYYKPGSLKAINCIRGYKRLIEFAKKYDISHDVCGKIIVATSNEEIPALENIYNRGLQNRLHGIKRLAKDELKEIEPHVTGLGGIFVPQTGIIDYPALAQKLMSIFMSEFGGEVAFENEVKDIKVTNSGITVISNNATFYTKKLITCAGLFSDRITSLTQKSNDLRIIPFRGEYYKLKPEKTHLVKNLIYPVPDPKFPFLGVHFTRMIGGGVEAGPNAVLAFKREGYRFRDFNFNDAKDTVSWPGFWKVLMKYGKTGFGEIYRSLSKTAFTKALQKLVPEIEEEHLIGGGAGVRAQACNRNGLLIDDFSISNLGNVVHVRNAPSPAATSCLSIGESISELI